MRTDVRAACVSLRTWSSWMRLRAPRWWDVIGRWSGGVLRAMTYRSTPLNSDSNPQQGNTTWAEKARPASLLWWICCCCFLPAVDLVKRTFHQWGLGRKKKGKCGNHYSNGDRGGISSGSLLRLFLPIYSISCCWLVSADLLQMMRAELDVLPLFIV